MVPDLYRFYGICYGARLLEFGGIRRYSAVSANNIWIILMALDSNYSALSANHIWTILMALDPNYWAVFGNHIWIILMALDP